jgi:hemerythrin-like domain-containing protein
MVITHNNKGEIVNSLNDCLGLLKDDNKHELAEAIDYFNKNGDNANLVQEHKELEQEFRSYEMSNESYYSCLNDVLELAEQLKDNIEGAKRLNRNEIIDSLKSIITQINNEI